MQLQNSPTSLFFPAVIQHCVWSQWKQIHSKAQLPITYSSDYPTKLPDQILWGKDGFDSWTGVFTAQSQLWHLCKCESITGVKHVIYFGQWDVSDVAGVKGERWSHGWVGLLSRASSLWERVLDSICCQFCLGSESGSPDLDAYLREEVDPPHWPN